MRNNRVRSSSVLGMAILAATMLMTSQSPVRANDGRWKLADDGSCYFDANDSGADQCDPTPGRNKLDANGVCYFDANDVGPDQCSLSLR